MFQGPLRPLSPDLPLSQLLVYATPSGTLGAWMRACSPGQCLYRVAGPAITGRVVASPDLGFLLARCDQVIVRERERAVVLAAETIIQWRAIQVSTSTPYLPGIDRLLQLFPELRPSRNGVLIPLGASSPEAVLAGCLAQGLPVTGSRIVYSAQPLLASLPPSPLSG